MARHAELISTRSTVQPKFLYCCNYNTNLIFKLNLHTKEKAVYQIPGYLFKAGRWSELPEGSILITGGDEDMHAVVKIDTLREWAVSSQQPMHTGRYSHAAVYYSQYLYVLGGYNGRDLSECERYVCAESRWEELPTMPVACRNLSALELRSSLYALGGEALYRKLDTIQKLSLDSLTWELMQLKLPGPCSEFPCFKTDTQVYLMISKTLYSFTPLQVKNIKTLSIMIQASTSYYYDSTLYYENRDANIFSLPVGRLS